MKSALTFEKWPLVAELKSKVLELFFSHFHFQLCHQRVLFMFDFTFFIYGQLSKRWVFRILIGCISRYLASSIASILKVCFSLEVIRLIARTTFLRIFVIFWDAHNRQTFAARSSLPGGNEHHLLETP